jgi:hypothetical protein
MCKKSFHADMGSLDRDSLFLGIFFQFSCCSMLLVLNTFTTAWTLVILVSIGLFSGASVSSVGMHKYRSSTALAKEAWEATSF